MNGLKEICVCGHDKATHHPDEPIPGNPGAFLRGNCLGVHCECKGFVDENDRPPVFVLPPVNRPPKTGMQRKPHSSVYCRCDACVTWRELPPWLRA